ncbi:MAG: NFACT family protein [Persicimonas sp.]
MTLSRAEIELLLEEIAPLAGRCVIQRVYEADRHTRVLQLREPGHTHHLLLCTKPSFTRIHFVDQRPTQPSKPSALTMQLRKWLGGSLLEQVRQVNDDRVVRFDVDAVDPAWEPPEDRDPNLRAPRVPVALIVELVGHNANWFLVDDDDTILGQLDSKTLGSRELGPGKRYEPPPPPPDPTIGAKVRWELDRLDPARFERSARVDRYYSDEIRQDRLTSTRQELRSRLERRLERLERRIVHVEADLERAERAEQYKRRGELLQSAWGEVERGAESARVPDFYAEGMPEVEIPLDPSLSLQKNIEQYYHEYHRLKDAHQKIEERLLESIEQRDEIEAALADLDEADDDVDALEALAERLESTGLLPPKRSPQRARGGDKKQRKPYRQFRSKHGTRILVGRGASDNDTLSTSVARGRDMWFHARDWAGAHVVLRMRKDQDSPKGQDLLDAATLAAWFSRGREDTLVDVTYTHAKYVRKPKGFPPGRVTVADASTVGVAIEKARVERLLSTEE